jgi:hypothetical protein
MNLPPDSPATPGDNRRTGGEIDEQGAIYYPGDEEAQRAPGSALVLLVLSLVAGGLYVWLFWPQKSGFDLVSALTLKTPELAVVGGATMWLGGVLFIRHGMVWAIRVGALLAALPMARILLDAVIDRAVTDVSSAALSFLLSAAPALLILVLTFVPAVSRWRRRRRDAVAAEAHERRSGRRGSRGPQRVGLG